MKSEKIGLLDYDGLYSIAKSQDNWQKFDYNQRILDAFASLFHFKAPVTAVHKYKDILCVSYNTQAEEYMKLQSKLGMCILKSGIIDELLAFYLLLNIDFLDFIESQCKYEWQQLHKSSNGELNFKNFKIECIKTKKVPTFLSKLEDFVSLIKETKTALQLPISDFCSTKEKKLKVTSKIQDKGQKLLMLESLNNELDQPEKNCLEKSYQQLTNKNKNVIGAYKDILLNLKIDKTEFKELFFHPLQDCYKISHSIQLGYKVNDIIILDNKNGVHADTNVVDHFSLQNSFDYIGVSRLACGYCHEYLDKKHAFHRGTHGVIDPQWKMNLSGPQEDDFKEGISNKTQKLGKGEEPFQHRRLSLDKSIEQDIFLEENFSLFNLKEKLDLIGEVHSIDIPESIYLNTSGYGGGCTI
jgi:hypothetical protein